MTLDEKFDIRDAFALDFKRLVRKYVPQPVRQHTDDIGHLLMMMQEQTSVFSPWIWSDPE